MGAAKRSHNFYPYALILETGLRTGERIGLRWDSAGHASMKTTMDRYIHVIGDSMAQTAGSLSKSKTHKIA